ncbi:MAG: response regulator [Anaerolineae bacterium]
MPEARLLIIEDDIELAEMLSVFFQAQGYEVFQAWDGREGVSLARQKLPNLVLLDVNLPDMDGFDVCRALRTTNRTRYIPITFLTQKNSRRDKVAGLELGADDYITKPFDIEELRLRVGRSIQRATREALTDPHTGLPGRPLILDRLAALIGSDDGWKYLAAEIKHIQPFRERYGFLATDEVLGFAARVLIDGVNRLGTDDDFIGHFGDEHFAIITYLEDPGALMAGLKRDFEAGVPPFYSYAEREQGYMVVEAAGGQTRHAPLMALSVEEAEPPPEAYDRAG